jgi:predicted PurR-regulated permease PerM
MKKLLFLSFLLFSSVNAYAFDINEALETLQESSKNGKPVDLKSVGKDLRSKANGKLEDLEKRIMGKVDGITARVEGKIQKVESIIYQVESIKNRALSIIKYAKIAAFIFSFSTILLLFFIWRLFQRIKNLHKLLTNVSNYKEFEKRLSALEAKKS